MLGQTIFGHYEITEHLKDTNYCHIYFAKDREKLNQDLRVVKRLKQPLSPPLTSQQAQDGLKAEAQILDDLKHDQIPQLFTIGEDNSQFYLVQDYIEGHDLSQELKPSQRLSEGEVIRLLLEILVLVKFVHEKKIIHCDINPSNLIRRTSDSKLVLIDFGSAKRVGYLGSNSSNQVQASIPGYAPPEQKNGNPEFNSDIYAVGMIGMQALTGLSAGDIPKDPNMSLVMWPSGTKTSAKLKAIIEKMVHPSFRERYESADNVLQALTKLSLPRRIRYKSFLAAMMAGDPTAVAQLVTGVVIGFLALIFGLPGFIAGIQQMSNSPDSKENVSSDNFKTYKNSQYKISIKHPKDWKPQEIGIDGEVVKFVHEPSKANVLISVKTLPNWLSLQEYTKQSVNYIENEFLDDKKQIKKYKIEGQNEKATLAKRPAFQVVYTGKDENNKSLKLMEVGNVKDQKAYVITYEAGSEKYDELSKIVDEMVDSFEN
ncbi:serine/threonine-protein kinase [Microcoleus sp. bin38.metabat.b11b12b14.051]|uniref:serine/threonine-protein kinase n=1 Tax=Microcoleus sp. bin38.metabat.b11b12b14.051 TaxID=2742709 RepID=UPI0025EC01E4|nr:serine/threonine-protein kinase [Microcoleus sp. bin38.metabat.b11b12b14.051]